MVSVAVASIVAVVVFVGEKGLSPIVVGSGGNDIPPRPLSAYRIKIFDKDPIFDVFGDDPIGSGVTLDDGTFRIDFRKQDFKKPEEFWESSK